MPNEPVKRYELIHEAVGQRGCRAAIIEKADGKFMRYAAHEPVATDRDRLARELAAYKQAVAEVQKSAASDYSEIIGPWIRTRVTELMRENSDAPR